MNQRIEIAVEMIKDVLTGIVVILLSPLIAVIIGLALFAEFGREIREEAKEMWTK